MKCIWTGCEEDGIVVVNDNDCYCLPHAYATWKRQEELLWEVYEQDKGSLDYLFKNAINKAKGITK